MPHVFSANDNMESEYFLKALRRTGEPDVCLAADGIQAARDTQAAPWLDLLLNFSRMAIPVFLDWIDTILNPPIPPTPTTGDDPCDKPGA